jgi:hypothetical protein
MRRIVSLAASCLLAACAHQSPSAMPGMAWSLNHAEGEGAKLAFGQPASDNVFLMMTCAPGSGVVRLSLSAPTEGRSSIALASRGTTGRYAGETVPAMSEGALIEAKVKAADPALASFARTGDLTVVEGGRRTVLPVRPAERAQIAAFFQSCTA